MQSFSRLQKGDRVAILSPSFAAPGKWPHVFELGLKRLREQFFLQPIIYPSTTKLGASVAERGRDLVEAFSDSSIKAVISSIGGNDQVTYVYALPKEVFRNNPKPFFGYSDNSHLANFLFLLGVPSYYGGSLFTQFAMQGNMDEYTVNYLSHALFVGGEKELVSSPVFNEVGLPWDDASLLSQHRTFVPNSGWSWDGERSAEGKLWGGCLECIEEMLLHKVPLPSQSQYSEIVLLLETSEELPSGQTVFRTLRAMGELGILERVQGLLVGRPKAWEFHKPLTDAEKVQYREIQQTTIRNVFRKYNRDAPVVFNLDFGHTDPQIPMPYGQRVRIDSLQKKLWAVF